MTIPQPELQGLFQRFAEPLENGEAATRFGHAWCEMKMGHQWFVIDCGSDVRSFTLILRAVYYKTGQIQKSECRQYRLADACRCVTQLPPQYCAGNTTWGASCRTHESRFPLIQPGTSSEGPRQCSNELLGRG